jgi:F0F1-type ATP synthase delta subunit
MKYKTRQYAEALAEALEGVDETTARTRIRTFIKLLKKHQMLGKAETIARVAERRLAKRADVTRVMLETADAPSDAFRTEIAELFDGKVLIEEKVQPDLLAGVRILIDDETLVDASGRYRLEKMFQSHSSQF